MHILIQQTWVEQSSCISIKFSGDAEAVGPLVQLGASQI